MATKRTRAAQTPEKPKRSPLWIEEGRRFAAILREKEIGQTEFASRIGRKFHNVHRWTRGYEFDADNQALAARELELPPDAFAAPNAGRHREREARVVLAQFQAEKPIAQSLSQAELAVLKSIRFHDAAPRPSVAFFEAVAFALKGAMGVDEIMSVAEENAALDEALSHKPPLRRRP